MLYTTLVYHRDKFNDEVRAIVQRRSHRRQRRLHNTQESKATTIMGDSCDQLTSMQRLTSHLDFPSAEVAATSRLQ